MGPMHDESEGDGMRKIDKRVSKGATFFLAMVLASMGSGTSTAAVDTGGHSPAATVISAPERTLLWKVERSGLKPSYVFGTIHSEDPRVADLSASVIQAFRVSNAFAMEMIPDQAALSHLSSAMFITSGPTLPELMGEEWFQRTAALTDAYGVPKSILASLKPWVVFMALTAPRANQGMFLDVILYSAALQDGKYIHGLETADEQIAAFDSIPMKDQLDMLKDVVVNHQVVTHINRALADSYARRDLAAMADMQSQFVPSNDPRLSQLYYQRTVDERNFRMVDRIVPRIEEQNAFIAIDAWHLPGENGVLHLLEQRGYQVSPVR